MEERMAQERLRGQRPRRDEEVDVAIVGAGPSGSVAALHLARAGLSVVALEQGSWPDYADYTGARPEHELVSTKLWHPNPNVRDDPSDYPVDTSTTDINPLMFAGVGGSATLCGAQWMHFLAVRLPCPLARRRGRRLALHLRGSASLPARN
jgi:flavin-dependent dehydrogenase